MKLKILLVEDEPLINITFCDFLKDFGHDVACCYSGTEALKILESEAIKFDFLITDIRLGSGPTGWDVGKCVRETLPDASIIYMSGDSYPDWFERGVKGSIMLTKPMALEELTRAIATLAPVRKHI